MTQASSKDLQKDLDTLNQKIADKNRHESYERASEIRNRGVIGNITDNIVAGNSIRGSIKSGVSDTFKAKMTGLKEKFDPINIAKTFTGNLGGAIVGKLMGRSSEDIAHFAGIRLSRNRANSVGAVDTAFYTTVTRGNRLRRGDSLSDVATKMFSFMQTTREEKIKHDELDKDFDKTKQEKDKQRHEQLLDAIAESKAKEIPEKIDDKPEKEESKLPGVPVSVKDIPKFSSRESVAAKTAEAPKPTVKPETPKAPEPTARPETPKAPEPEAPVTPPKSTTVEPEAPAPVTPKTATPEAAPSITERVKNFFTSKPVTTAAKAGVAVAATGAAADVIAKEEGVATKAYWDPPKQKTLVSIGYGHQIKDYEYKQGFIQAGDEQIPIKGDRGIDTVMSKDQAKKLLSQDLPKYEDAAKKPLGDLWNKLNDKQKAALTSYAYNTGSTQSLMNVGLGEALKQGNIEAAAAIIRDKGIRTAKGVVNATLVDRRAREAALFQSDSKLSTTNAPPKTGDRLTTSSVQNQELTQTTPQNTVVVNNSVTAIGGTTVNKQIMSTPSKDIKPTYIDMAG